MKLREIFRKYKIKAKKIYTVIILTIIEIVMILWFNSWVPTPMIMIPLVQFVAIFEHRDVWKKLTEKEKSEITLSEEELDNFIKGIIENVLEGKSVEEIIKNVKEE